jgi:ribosomal protein L17
MSKPISSPRNSVSSSESLVESSVDEKNDSKEKSNSEPVMTTKRSSQRDIFSSNKSSTTIIKSKNLKTEFNKKIDHARQTFVQNNESWKRFIEEHILKDGDLYLHHTTGKEFNALLNCLDTSPNPKITSMCSRNANIDAATATALTKAIKSNPTIATLEMSYGWFDAAGLKIFTDSIIINPTSNITSLILNYSNIGDDLVKVIADAIIANPNTKITGLDLRDNQIDNEGAKALAKAIEMNPTNITELKLSFNSISEEGTKALASAIKYNSSLTLLELKGPYGNEEDKKIIQDQCELNAKRSLQYSNTSEEKVNSAPYSNKVISKDHLVVDTKEQPSKEKNNKKS